MNILYKVCKRTINRGNYNKDILEEQIKAFFKAYLITGEEYEELINMLGG